jgi:hypothetical protein
MRTLIFGAILLVSTIAGLYPLSHPRLRQCGTPERRHFPTDLLQCLTK